MESQTVSATAESADHKKKKRITIEILLLLGLIYFPNLLQAIDSYLSNLPPDYSHHALGGIVGVSIKLGQGLFLIWFAWRTGRGLKSFGIVKPRPIDLFYGLGAFLLLLGAMKAMDGFENYLSAFPMARASGAPIPLHGDTVFL